MPRAVAALALACGAYHLLAFAALHALVPSVGMVSGIISDYVNSPYRGLARSTFAAFGLMWAALAFGLFQALQRGWLTRVGVALMGLAAISLVLLAFAPDASDPRNAEQVGPTLSVGGGAGRAALFVSLVVLSVAVRGDPRWKRPGTTMLALSATSLLLLVITLVALLERGFAGITQRAIFLLVYAWVFVAATRLHDEHKGS